jgi:DNA primase
VLDGDGHPVLGSDGSPQHRQQITGFRPVPVFDISQTDGPPLPEAPRPVLLSGRAPAGLWDALVNEITQRGYRLLRGPADALSGANGVTKVTEREVWVRDDVDEAQAVKTLTHELAHILLHTDTDQTNGCAGIREVEAESVAHLVMATHGVQTGSYSFPYVAIWAYPLAAVEHVPMTDIVGRVGTRVMRAAAEIIDVTSAELGAVQELATAALTARVTAATERAGELRERAAASLLPPVERATLLGVIADSQDYYRRQVQTSWVPGYLAERRLRAAITEHDLGYAPKSWTAVTEHLRNLGYSDDHIEASGMATRSRTGHLIDRFRDRLTIPLHDRDGTLVGFTARSAPHAGDREGPKYLNTPATAIFHKREVLYGIAEHARLTGDAIPVICEGPLDAIAIAQIAAGRALPLIGVATVGTAFTEQHARLLLAVTDQRPICLAFDGDTAGQHATEAAWRRLTNGRPYDVRVAELPEGTDPASLAATEPATLAAALSEARPAAYVVAQRQIDAADLNGHAPRELAAFRSLSELTTRMPADQRPVYLLELAARLRIDPADAATVAVEHNPTILMERIASRAQQLTGALGDGPTTLRESSGPDQSLAKDHVVRAAIAR